MSSSKNSDSVVATFNAGLVVLRGIISYLGRFFSTLMKNTIWIFKEAPGAHNDLNDYCRTHFGSAPEVWLKVVVSILLLPLVLAALVFWSAIRAI
jgi:hypothetical protein